MSASALRRVPEAVVETQPQAVFETDVVEPGLDLASTLRAITTRLLATCSHHPTRDRKRKSSTTSFVPAGASGASSEYFT